MIINFKEIKDLLQNGSLADIVRETGLPRRTLENYKYKTNDAFENMENTLTALQKYVNKEKIKMKNIMENEKTLLEAINEDVVSWYNEEGLELDLIDIYYEPETDNLHTELRGMAYNGDDKEAYLVAHIDDEEVFIDHIF